MNVKITKQQAQQICGDVVIPDREFDYIIYETTYGILSTGSGGCSSEFGRITPLVLDHQLLVDGRKSMKYLLDIYTLDSVYEILKSHGGQYPYGAYSKTLAWRNGYPYLGVNWNGMKFSMSDIWEHWKSIGASWENLLKEKEKAVENFISMLGGNFPDKLDIEKDITSREWTYLGCGDKCHVLFQEKALNAFNPDWKPSDKDRGDGTPLDFTGPKHLHGLPEGFAGGSYHKFRQIEDEEPCDCCGCPRRIQKVNISYASNGAINPGCHITAQIYCRWCGDMLTRS